MDLSKKLSFLVNEKTSLDVTFDNNNPEDSTIEDTKTEKPKKKEKDSQFINSLKESDIDEDSKSLSAVTKLLDQFESEDLAAEFDMFLDNDFDEEDVELKNSLISLGRKYARETAVTAETSEIIQAFSGSEKYLRNLYDEIETDKSKIQKDLDQMRMSRSRNYKTIAELNEQKNSYINSQISIVKELNSIKKSQFDLKYKDQKAKNGIDDGNNDISSSMIRNLFSLGKGGMIDALGGYEEISGASDAGIHNEIYDDDKIHDKYFSSNEEESEGDLYLKYENMNIELIMLIDEDDNILNIIAEDDEGNVIPDYPVPEINDGMGCTFNKTVMTAEDGYHRKYKLRIV